MHSLRESRAAVCEAKAVAIRAMFSNQLEPKRTAEIRERMLAADLPI